MFAASEFVLHFAKPVSGEAGCRFELEVIQKHCTALFGRAQAVDDQPRIVSQGIEISDPAGQTSLVKLGNASQYITASKGTGFPQIFPAAQQIVHFDAEAQLPERPLRSAISWKNERQWLRQVRRDAMQNLFLVARFPHQAQAALCQVTQSAMQQSARTAAGSESEIVLLGQSNPQPAYGRIARDTGAYDPATNDQQIERFLRKTL